ncbi:MAG: lamin tail domain-containing protein [Bacteroidota bacterium]
MWTGNKVDLSNGSDFDRAQNTSIDRAQTPVTGREQIPLTGLKMDPGSFSAGSTESRAGWGDVVINEVMCDPTPAVSLPECEYLEFFNRSDHVLDLEGWHVKINEKDHVLDPLRLGPGEYGILAGPGGDEILQERILILPSSAPFLPNGGATIALYNSGGTLVHVTRYGDPGKGPGWKQEGGWSLEATDPDRVCHTSRLWEYSVDPRGGTPGKKNSIYSPQTDTEPPRLAYTGIDNAGSITLHFTEMIRILPEHRTGIVLRPSGVRPDSISTGQPVFDHMTLHFPENHPGSGDRYLLVPSVSDCSGNRSPLLNIPVGQVALPRFSSVQINEVMYDPPEGAPEFIELHNPGDLFYDLGKMCLDVAKEGGSLTDPEIIGEHSRVLPPGGYAVLSGSSSGGIVYGTEHPEKWLRVENMPALYNGGGTVYLTDRSGNVIDLVHYNDRMHMAVMDDTRGISLERISSERPGTDPGNWHSAASIAGYSTPGEQNSQSLRNVESGKELSLEPKVFSPDQDGYRDILQISIGTGEQGWVIRLWVTDLKGRLIRQLANNHVTGTSSGYTWDGERDDGRMAGEGIYVVHLRGYHPSSGKRLNRKVAAGVIYR